MPTCNIVGAGKFTACVIHPAHDDYIIVADGGLRVLDVLCIKIHLLACH
ncbi:MAG: hypothetical protein PUD16_04705 [bacterium]|nr:hypothetical protein [bacterium]